MEEMDAGVTAHEKRHHFNKVLLGKDMEGGGVGECPPHSTRSF